jgi:hypothetical protein
MNALVPVICALVGALVYALSTPAKIAELGRLLFLAATIALMFAFSGHVAHLF